MPHGRSGGVCSGSQCGGIVLVVRKFGFRGLSDGMGMVVHGCTVWGPAWTAPGQTRTSEVNSSETMVIVSCTFEGGVAADQ